VHGNISSKLSEGTNRLIRDDAFPVIDYTDVLYALGITDEAEPAAPPAQTLSTLAPDEKLVYDAIDLHPAGLDELLERTQLPGGKLHLICIALELKKLIKKLPGARYTRAV